jgi:hypothetical protein
VVNKKIADWTKIRAYSENKEANADFKEKCEIVLQQLRGPPGPGFSFSEQVSLVPLFAVSLRLTPFSL